MTASVPNSFSSDDLKKLMDNAPHEADCGCGECPSDITDNKEDFSPERINAIVQKALDDMGEQSPGPLVHKVAMLAICERMYDWHNSMGEMQIRDDEPKSAMAWLRDAGHFQVIFNVLRNISVGKEDFTCGDD